MEFLMIQIFTTRDIQAMNPTKRSRSSDNFPEKPIMMAATGEKKSLDLSVSVRSTSQQIAR